MNLIETYALDMGAKIGKPFIYEEFFPMTFSQKYITFHTTTKYPAKSYDYWNSVISVLKPVLDKHNISIVQLGMKDDMPVPGVVDLRGRTNINQLAYIISKSMLHFGGDSFNCHLAGHYNIPLVSLYSVIHSKTAGPYWGDKNKQVLIDAYERFGNKKPSYSHQEYPKSINLVKPEEIINSIFKLLNLGNECGYSTVFFGNRFDCSVIHNFIPSGHYAAPNNFPMEYRMDIKFDEVALQNQLQTNPCIVFTNKPISLNLLRAFKQHVNRIVYIIDGVNDSPSFVDSVRGLGIQVSLISYLPQEEINKKKIDYYRLGHIHKIDCPSKETLEKLKGTPNLYFSTNRLIHDGNKVFLSFAHWKAGLEANANQFFYPIIDDNEFWDDLDFYHVVQK